MKSNLTVSTIMNAIGELKVLILHQQELAAKLARSDHRSGARVARGKLIALLNKLDHLQEHASSLRAKPCPST
jgi:hypothetical protein